MRNSRMVGRVEQQDETEMQLQAVMTKLEPDLRLLLRSGENFKIIINSAVASGGKGRQFNVEVAKYVRF